MSGIKDMMIESEERSALLRGASPTDVDLAMCEMDKKVEDLACWQAEAEESLDSVIEIVEAFLNGHAQSDSLTEMVEDLRQDQSARAERKS